LTGKALSNEAIRKKKKKVLLEFPANLIDIPSSVFIYHTILVVGRRRGGRGRVGGGREGSIIDRELNFQDLEQNKV